MHLKTLFYPWKRQMVIGKPGFHPYDLAATVSFNIISRLLGAIVRSILIFYGLIFTLMTFITMIIPVILWHAVPFLTLPLYLAKIGQKEDPLPEILSKSKKNIFWLFWNLVNTDEGRFTFRRLGYDTELLIKKCAKLQPPEKIQSKIDFDNFSRLLSIHNAIQGRIRLRISDLLESLSLTFMPLKIILEQDHLKNDDVYKCAKWYENGLLLKEPPVISNLQRIKNIPGIGVDWAYGYTVEFDKYSTDLSKKVSPYPLLFGRDKELKDIQRILLKTQNNNCLIVGEPGTTRHIIIETLAQKFYLGDCQPSLSHKRILLLDMQAVLASKSSITEVKGVLEYLLAEAVFAGNIIIVIDEIDKYCSSLDGRIDVSDVIVKFAQSSVGFIGITTSGSFHKFIETNPVISPLFEKIEITEPTDELVVSELEMSIVPVIERKYDIFVTYPAIKKIMEDSGRFISSKPYPAKAIDLLDESTIYLATKIGGKILLPRHIDEYLTQKMHIPLGDVDEREREKLANMENYLHERIINQETAVHVISSALRRRRLDISSTNKPIGTFLFLGPTGVGKTETAKALAQVYFGSEENMLRFDMSQYSSEEGLARLIGSIKIGNPGELTSKIKDRPYTLLLFDEFEKAGREIFNLFLTLLDEGYITDSSGKKIDAKNTIIIATSNAGAEHIRESVNAGIKGDKLRTSLIEYILTAGIFSPELVNRFDAVVVFTPLSEGNLREVAKMQLDALNKRLSKNEISLSVTPVLINKLVEQGFDRQFGARAMKRMISETIEDRIAQKLLKGEVKKGEVINIDL